MRTSYGVFRTLFATLLICTMFVACGDNTIDGPIVDPDETVSTSADRLNVSIQLFSCGEGQISLLVYNPDFENPDFYKQERYEITWFVGDGHVLSETIWLECVGDGAFSVQVTEIATGITGSHTINL